MEDVFGVYCSTPLRSVLGDRRPRSKFSGEVVAPQRLLEREGSSFGKVTEGASCPNRSERPGEPISLNRRVAPRKKKKTSFGGLKKKDSRKSVLVLPCEFLLTCGTYSHLKK
jgi:hypothetical protein